MVLAISKIANAEDLETTPSKKIKVLSSDFFTHCALVCVDIQEQERKPDLTQEQLPILWRKMGFTAQDVNAASAFAWDVCRPNAVKVVEACRKHNLKIVFVHWGYQFNDGVDLDPDIYRMMRETHGDDAANWPHHLSSPDSMPAKVFHVQAGEYVLAKTSQDTFTSTNIGFLLRNLGIKHIVFIGGHTGACLGKTAASAKRAGYEILCITDATYNACESVRLRNIQETSYDHVLTTDAFLRAIGK